MAVENKHIAILILWMIAILVLSYIAYAGHRIISILEEPMTIEFNQNE